MKIEGTTSRGYMVRISEMISALQKTKDQFGDTCVYVRGSIVWGATALNFRDDDRDLDKASPPQFGDDKVGVT